jgi:hypothetical protein
LLGTHDHPSLGCYRETHLMQEAKQLYTTIAVITGSPT